ncbi:MAG: hypothetical protein WBA74_04320, partial [Cyclobacteriaceae bacterium]
MKQLLIAFFVLLAHSSQGQNTWKPIAEKYLEVSTRENAWLFADDSEQLLDSMVRTMVSEFNPAKQNRYLLHLLATLSLRRNIGDYN